jgi:hypothetical protein
MRWMAYRVEDNRVVWLRIIKSDVRPSDVDVLNNGFRNEQEALGLMAHYLRTNEAGFLTVPMERERQHVTHVQRIRLAFEIAPLLIGLLVGSAALSSVTFLFLMLHIF